MGMNSFTVEHGELMLKLPVLHTSKTVFISFLSDLMQIYLEGLHWGKEEGQEKCSHCFLCQKSNSVCAAVYILSHTLGQIKRYCTPSSLNSAALCCAAGIVPVHHMLR